ncbi:hypothetical protein NQZ79_g5424 [Umbelopsis isabellina]|nr:hypothetical protein NQZ79_g5424 [Umbelopsis isabellina]
MPVVSYVKRSSVCWLSADSGTCFLSLGDVVPYELTLNKIICYYTALFDLGDAPYNLLKEPLKRATAQQLYRIEKCNPVDLWLYHCLTFRDIRLEYEAGNIPPDTNWREMYIDRHEENQRKRQLIGAKIKSHYNQLQNEKEARSTKFLTKAIPMRKRRSEYNSGSNAKRARGNSLFAKTMLAAKQEASIYHSHNNRALKPTTSSHSSSSQPPTAYIRIDKEPSALKKAYISQPLKEPTPIKPSIPLKPPPAQVPKGVLEKDHSMVIDDKSKDKQAKRAKDSAIVNFGIFKELSGH